MPVLIRGAQAVLSPTFGAPATPGVWQAVHTVSNTFLPSGFEAAAGAAATGTAVAAPAVGAVGLAVEAAGLPAYIMNSIARRISTSESSAMPPRAGTPA